jgi:predicted acyl esterase
VIARLTTSGAPGTTQIASRLWDVAPDGTSQTLVARGLYRPAGENREVWELHANGWHFAKGHTAKLELLGADPPYARPSNGDFEIEVERLQLRLPVRERPNCKRIRRKARPVVPKGQRRAPGLTRPRGCRKPAA